MQVENATLENFLTTLNNENDIEVIRQVAAQLAGDLKTTKEALVKICTMFGLHKEGKFVDKPSMKTITAEIGGIMVEVMNPFGQTKLAEKFGFLADMVTIAKKYQSF